MQLHQRVARSRAALIGSVSLALLAIACRESGNDASPSAPPVSPAQRAAIADTLRRAIASAYDFSRPGVVPRLMALYPDSGPVVSAAAGRVVTSRAALQGQIQHFWEAVGQNMRRPRWVWGDTHVEVLSPSAAVLTATYTIPHRTPLARRT